MKTTYTKATFTLPTNTIKMLNRSLKKGEKSSFVNVAVQKELYNYRKKRETDPRLISKKIIKLRKKISRGLSTDQIDRAIK